METGTHRLDAVASSLPYDRIDVGWIERRLKDQTRATARTSRLSAYFDGFMEFAEEPPSISRSPSPDLRSPPIWQTGAGHNTTHPDPFSRNTINGRRTANGIPQRQTRRSTTESDSDSGYFHQRRIRRQLTPMPRHKPTHRRPLNTRKITQRPGKPNDKVVRVANAHAMETRSKSRRSGRGYRRKWLGGKLSGGQGEADTNEAQDAVQGFDLALWLAAYQKEPMDKLQAKNVTNAQMEEADLRLATGSEAGHMRT
ncbi:uncharacterized protein BP5553_02994 [Venustampulla echinocandica]|uniref:Uncharacterized protein n=1 Tax=Venustampulla echinocandica TaxID=2656787 RepID=A0A370TT35_9HELO|nr:uncharacterized protein BP5553_02994 [Venustampulla echinocandica]RDL38654.1 hypothetical protein BP5553_02994 [Venustampulla echinocandica]